ncbi:epoxide hydrolase family protein [Halocatena marina]|uniref:Epoxide hydrolase family protein n=1 Tax=Halocatena marina TaxID=2934937 RepID=A0ABD5YZM6_9EURY
MTERTIDEIYPFSIEVPQANLDDLRNRLKNTRWPNEVQPTGWQKGTELDYMKELVGYWIEHYDWRTVEAKLNHFEHYVARFDDLDVHFIHETSGQPNAMPIVLLHGWCESFYSYVRLIDWLTGKETTDSKNGLVFDVVVPSLPGFDFSTQPDEDEISATLAADAVAELMQRLGYETYAVHGGDWGGTVAQELARNHTDHIIGLHLSDVPYNNYFIVDREQASNVERRPSTPSKVGDRPRVVTYRSSRPSR